MVILTKSRKQNMIKIISLAVLSTIGIVFSRIPPLTLAEFKSVRPNMAHHPSETVEFKYILLSVVFLLPLFMYIVSRVGNRKLGGAGPILDAHLGCIITFLITAVIKWLVGKERPDYHDRLAQNLLAQAVLEGRRSFPSGHSSTMMALVFYLVYETMLSIKNTRQLVTKSILVYVGILVPITTGLFVCVSRIFDNRHDQVDVCTGAALGIFVPFIVNRILLARRKKKHQNKIIEESAPSVENE
ncbi:diacylglycerol diphosphate phosphatase / phosphatidate phosphatase [Nematocida sp. AWRm78]|nr:diacylglycerol diphosphate phosphatase / phosphatidate phosphatase [Nematocida sp. AWRm79]KAI5186767.1 diacylglycerol diphosphate phosphatase / phosphatidate phosphatase [Nematocida sp. AWRm78]